VVVIVVSVIGGVVLAVFASLAIYHVVMARNAAGTPTAIVPSVVHHDPSNPVYLPTMPAAPHPSSHGQPHSIMPGYLPGPEFPVHGRHQLTMCTHNPSQAQMGYYNRIIQMDLSQPAIMYHAVCNQPALPSSHSA
jgi:hypothetical protein